MSCGYNDRLSHISYKGECGDKETEEPRSKWAKKAAELAAWMRASTYTVAFTGAGISCSSGIPDFRGPKGVWTLEKKGLKPEFDKSFEDAQPSFTHMALVALIKAGFMHYIVSQNVDGLHIKSGVPRAQLSELHGNIFAEHCDRCDREYIRAFDVAGMGCKPTGRLCEDPACLGPLRDKTIDWDSKLPDAEFDPAIEAHKKADLAICLGTSLRIRPAGNMPLRTLRKHKKAAPGRLCIVNLQKTHLDRSASMRLHVRTDALFRELCRLLDVKVDFEDAAAEKADADAHASCTAAAAAAASSSAAAAALPKKQPAKSAAPLTEGRPTRRNTERLRSLYNPSIAVKAEPEEEEDSGFAAAAASPDSCAAASSSPAAAAASSSAAAPSSAAPAASSSAGSARQKRSHARFDQEQKAFRSLEEKQETTRDQSTHSKQQKREDSGTAAAISNAHAAPLAQSLPFPAMCAPSLQQQFAPLLYAPPGLWPPPMSQAQQQQPLQQVYATPYASQFAMQQ